MKQLCKAMILLISFNIMGNDLVNPPEKEAFFGNTESTLNVKEVKPLNRALVKEGECLKYKKNGETYWTKYETEIIKVDKVGRETLKVRKISFINSKSDKWMDSDPYSLDFEFQMLYELFPCPDMKDKLSDEKEKEILKKMKKR